MLLHLCNKRGISILEVVIAMFLTTVGIMAILSLQPSAWRTQLRSDLLGRGAEILARQIESTEAFIMNPCNTVTVGTTSVVIKPSGAVTTITGDTSFTVTTTITNLSANSWSILVRVSWPSRPNGISETLVVSRQSFFKVGCT